jgi:hypothetical protein
VRGASSAPVVKAEGITLFPRLFLVADFIETSVAGIRSSLLLGGALVAIVLTLFLYNLRTAFISLTAIPRTLRGYGQPVNDALLRYLSALG